MIEHGWTCDGCCTTYARAESEDGSLGKVWPLPSGWMRLDQFDICADCAKLALEAVGLGHLA